MTSNGTQAAWQRFSRECHGILGYEGLGGEQDLAGYSINGEKPQAVLFPGSISQVSQILALAQDCRTPVVPAGSGTRLNPGGEPRCDYAALSLRRLSRVIDYQPANMTLEVEAGITLEEIQKITGEKAQWLPLDPPLSKTTTAGGLIAANRSGPMRHSQGTPRDLLIGIKVVQADGTIIKGGGRVVKNVAGYDLPRLYCGSFGTLGVIVEACFKVRPKPEKEEIVCLSFTSLTAAMEFFFRLWNSELEPLFVELSNFSPFAPETAPGFYVLTLGFGGIGEEIEYQLDWLRRQLSSDFRELEQVSSEERGRIKQTLCDFPVSGSALARFKTSLLPSKIEAFLREIESGALKSNLTVLCQSHVASGIVHARVGKMAMIDSACEYIVRLRSCAESLGGSLVIQERDPSIRNKANVSKEPQPSFRLARTIKKKLDPRGILGADSSWEV
ncbi:MAG: FAD-binding oxidoreductase [Candidatus Binatia bacterium]